MENWKFVLVVIALSVLALGLVVKAGPGQSDNLGTPVPADNGTSTLLNVTARMQQYVGFFGQVVMMVRLNVTNVTGAPNYQLYNSSVTSGRLYFFKGGTTPTLPFVLAANNSQTDGNFSLTGYYITGNHFNKVSTVCGIASTNHINTTDDYMVGILRDSAATPNYFLCVDIRQVSSNYGFGNVGFEAVVPKTSLYLAYDIWIDATT